MLVWYGIKTLLANGLSSFPTKGNPVFSNGPKSLPKNPRDCPILCKWVFDKFVLADGPFAKSLQSFETCVLVNRNLWRKAFDELFRKHFRVVSLRYLFLVINY